MRTRTLPWVTVFGLGHLRPASGTWGSLPPVLLAAGLFAVGLGQPDAPVVYVLVMAAVVVVFSAACILQGDRAEAVFQEKDPSEVVADETAGQAIALLWLPRIANESAAGTAVTLLMAFFAFRILDILKPWPAKGLQRIPGGWGILIDDLVAGLYALCLVHIGGVWLQRAGFGS